MTSKDRKVSKKNKVEHEIKISEYWQERTIFPSVVPKEVKVLIKNMPSFNKNFFRKLIKIALGYIQGTASSQMCEIAFQNLCVVRECVTEEDVMDLSIQYTGIISLLRAVLKANLKTVREDTLMHELKELGLPVNFATDICKVVFGPTHPDIVKDIISHNPHLPKLEHLEWQVEVTLSNSWSSKVLESSVTMSLNTSDGREHSFEVPISAFHFLRHSTATILRQMQAIEKRR